MNSPKAFTRQTGIALQCSHATFKKKADLITTGNVCSNVQSSTYIRPRQQLECNGITNKPGHLQNFDLDGFAYRLREMDTVLAYIRRTPFFETNEAIAYRFFHYEGNTRQLHGVVITDTQHRVLRRFDRDDLVGRRSAKSESVIDFCLQFISVPGSVMASA